MSFLIVNNTGANPIGTTGGLFTSHGTSLPEGAFFTTGGQQFSITDTGGSGGNDVLLVAIPEPTAPAALLAGLTTLLALPRLRRRRFPVSLAHFRTQRNAGRHDGNAVVGSQNGAVGFPNAAVGFGNAAVAGENAREAIADCSKAARPSIYRHDDADL